MAKNNRWLLPDGVEEILPKQAWQIESFQRQALDLYRSWGYELIIPPLIEYSESLLIAMGSDMDLQTFKLTDQLSGRTLAIRADITPQTARIDAHGWPQSGPSRFCYIGTVVRTKPKTQLSSRLPIELGAELYGDASLHSDQEAISLMLATIALAGVERVHLDLGHLGIYRGLVEATGLAADQITLLTDAFERKAATEVKQILCENLSDQKLIDMLAALVELNGDLSVLAKAKTILADAPAAVRQALEDLDTIAQWVNQRFPDTPIVLDLAEIRAYSYHTGLIFAAYIDGVGHSVANGGRFDGIGKAFGRSRPATGFTVSVNTLLPQIFAEQDDDLIIAPHSDDTALEQCIADLRAQGKRVVRELPDAGKPSNCGYQLVLQEGEWQIQALN